MTTKKKIKLSPEEYQKKLQELKEMEEMIALKEGLPHLFGYPFYSWARRVFESKNKEILLTAANQVSKPLCVKTEIPTPNGFKLLGELCVGDYVFGQDGKPTRIIDIPYIGEESGYEVVFNDGSSVACGITHDWICKGYKERFRKKYKIGRGKKTGKEFDNVDYGKWTIVDTKTIILRGKYSPETKATLRYSIPISEPAKNENKSLFDPYLVGLYLGNGSNHSICFNGLDHDVHSYVLKYGRMINAKATAINRVTIYLNNKCWLELSRLGLCTFSYQKTIPDEYMFGSEEQRISLLHGLMDSDGTCDKRGTNYNYSTTSEKLAKQVLELVCSLGGIGQIKRYKSYYYKKDNGEKINCRDHYVVTIWTRFNPFRSKRKSSRWRFSEKYKHERVIEKIIPVDSRRMKCITVDNEDGSFLCTRNYIVTHNSSTAIRKNIHLATAPKLWKEFWPALPDKMPPGLFWYFYPTQAVATTEFEEKWVKTFLPKGEYKNHPQFGWKEEYNKNEIYAIHFNTGVTIQFKSYSQKVKDLQTSSVYHLTCDEELPVEYLPELKARLNATDGYFLTVFTATLGQIFWKQAMEPSTGEEEKFPDALKITVSLFDSMRYEDGSPSPWTEEKIKRAIANCPTEAEVQRRVYGRFVKSEGLMYEGFDLNKNMSDNHPLPQSWDIYAGVDPGSGGKSGHPAAIVFVAVNPQGTEGRVFRGWRGDGIPTTAEDILLKYIELRGNINVVTQVYDYSAKDFFTIASRTGQPFTPADKGRDRGVAMLNSLFKSGMLKIQRGDPELEKLVSELCSLGVKTAKTVAQDDFTDALRYCIMSIPWDFSRMNQSDEKVVKPKVEEVSRPLTESELRKEWFLGDKNKAQDQTIEDELDEWSELLS